MKKILYFASVWAHIYNFHMPHIHRLEDLGFEVHVAADGVPEDSGFSHVHNLAIRKSFFALENIAALASLIKLIKHERFDIIYVHTTLAAFLVRLVKIFSFCRNVHLIYVCHGYFFETNQNGRVAKNLRSFAFLLAEKLLASQTDMLVLMNHEDFISAQRYCLCRDIRFCHGMGLDPTKYEKIPASEKQIAGPVFLCVGELFDRKNQKQIIGAFREVVKCLPGAELWFAGDGRRKNDYKQLVKKLGLEHSCRFFGHISNISNQYCAADVFISASRCEGLPFCVMEALYFGLPVIASDIKGHRDLVEHGINGMLFELDNELQLAAHMIRLGSSEKERTRLASRAVLPEKYFANAVALEFASFLNLP